MVLIRRVNVKLSPSFNGNAPNCCPLMAEVVILFTGLRHDPIRQKAEGAIYNFGIQGFRSCHFGL
jgi:hypothetical protein